jgi:hypothetical protein
VPKLVKMLLWAELARRVWDVVLERQGGWVSRLSLGFERGLFLSRLSLVFFSNFDSYIAYLFVMLIPLFSFCYGSAVMGLA